MPPLKNTPLSVLDLAVVRGDATVREALDASVAMAQCAERGGYKRVWYAEHHNMASIASSATSVLIAHVAAHTETIRLGSGGIMLPNHSPLTIAEQFGTLATLHPDRIDLGLGRAPGTDQVTMRALRRDAMSSESFPEDVLELQGFLGDESRIPGVKAIPGAGTNVPLYILGSSTFGAQLAAQLGLPYAFASHFAPQALTQAVEIYRARFNPSEQADSPWVIAAVNVIVAPTEEEAAEELHRAKRSRTAALLAPGRRLSEAELDAVMASPGGQQVASMMRYTAAGTPDAVSEYLEDFRAHADADELIVAPGSRSVEGRLQSLELLGEVAGLG